MASNSEQVGRRISDASDVDASSYSETIHKLNEARALSRAVFQNVAFGIIHTDSAGIISSLNPAAEAIVGQAETDAAGKHIHEVIVPYCNHEHQGGLFEYLQSAGVARAESPLALEILRPNGESIPVELAVHQTLTREGSIVTLFIRDVSTAKNAEKKLRAARAHAESATSAKSRFLATMSHEIRTPLNAVLGSLDLLAEGSLTGEQRRLLEAARLSGRAVKNITDDIIDLAAIESGRLKLNRASFNLFELVEETVYAVAPGAYYKGLEIALHADVDVPNYVIGDMRRLQQVLLNFFTNAIKFTVEGAVTLRLETLNAKPGSVDIRFWVSDTGIGIPDSSQGRLFQEFFRGDVSNSKEFTGSGLGLAISKTLVSAMGGDVGIETRSGGGSRFWFSVNLGVDDATIQPITSATALGPGHCVIVQANTVSAHVIQRQLMSWGKNAVVAKSSKHAISYIAQEMQHGRPVLEVYIDAEEAEKYSDEWAKVSAAEDAPLIALLVRPDAGDIKQICEKIQPSVCLAKPIRITDLWLLNSQKKIFIKNQENKNTSASLKGLKQLTESQATLGARILLAEDSEVNQMVVKAMLEAEDYIVDVVSNGVEAVIAASTSSYDLILMDLMMPEKNGLQTTAEIRQQLKSSCPPIIAITGNVFDDDRKRCMQAGMKGFLVKPVDKRQLISTVVSVLNEPERPMTEIPLTEHNSVDESLLPSGSSQHEDSIDEQVLEKLREQVGEPKARLIAHQFVIEAKEFITQIVNYSGDTNVRRLAAHTLKSTAATFGLNKLHVVAGKIEQALEANDQPRLGILIPDLRKQSLLLKGELQDRNVPVQVTSDDKDILKLEELD